MIHTVQLLGKNKRFVRIDIVVVIKYNIDQQWLDL